jgi:hypothetical protein
MRDLCDREVHFPVKSFPFTEPRSLRTKRADREGSQTATSRPIARVPSVRLYLPVWDDNHGEAPESQSGQPDHREPADRAGQTGRA